MYCEDYESKEDVFSTEDERLVLGWRAATKSNPMNIWHPAARQFVFMMVSKYTVKAMDALSHKLDPPHAR